MGSASSSSPLFPSKATKQRDASLPPSRGGSSPSPPFPPSQGHHFTGFTLPRLVCVCGELFLRSCVCLSFVCCPMHLVASEEEEEGWGAFARRSTENAFEVIGIEGWVGEAKSIVQTPRSSGFFCPRRGKCILLIESFSCTGARTKKNRSNLFLLLFFCCRSVDNGGRHLNRSERGRKGEIDLISTLYVRQRKVSHKSLIGRILPPTVPTGDSPGLSPFSCSLNRILV